MGVSRFPSADRANNLHTLNTTYRSNKSYNCWGLIFRLHGYKELGRGPDSKQSLGQRWIVVGVVGNTGHCWRADIGSTVVGPTLALQLILL